MIEGKALGQPRRFGGRLIDALKQSEAEQRRLGQKRSVQPGSFCMCRVEELQGKVEDRPFPGDIIVEVGVEEFVLQIEMRGEGQKNDIHLEGREIQLRSEVIP